MSYLLDTDILVFVLRGHEELRARCAALSDRDVQTSIITHAELMFGAYNSTHKRKNLQKTEALLERLRILPFDEAASLEYARMKAELSSKGRIIADLDLMIAAICLARRLTLVTNNGKHFKRIPELKWENWVEG